MMENSTQFVEPKHRNSETQSLSANVVRSFPDSVGWKPRILFQLDGEHILHVIDYIGERHILIKNATEAQVYICKLLRNSTSINDLMENVNQLFPRMTVAAIQRFVFALYDRNLLEDRHAAVQSSISSDELIRYDRQLRYFSFFETPAANRFQRQLKLKDSSVAIIGLGGVGNWVAWHLAAMGIGRLVLIDHDRVELSNLNRQVLYSEKEIGQWKVDVAARRLKNFNPELLLEPIRCRVTAPEDVERVVRNSQMVVLTADQPRVLIRRWVNQVCVEQKLPYIQGSLDAYLLQIGPMYCPDSTGCYTCREIQQHDETPRLKEAQINAFMKASRPQPPLIGPLCGFVGTSIAMDVVRYLAEHEAPVTKGKYYLIDTRKWGTHVLPVPRVQDCPTCRDR